MDGLVYGLPAGGPLAVAGLCLLLVALVVTAALTAGRRRSGMLAGWARGAGLVFEGDLPAGEPTASFLIPFRAAGLLENVGRPVVRNLARGPAPGGEWLVFDLNAWRENRYAESEVVSWTVVALAGAGRLPAARLEPALPVVSRLSAACGGRVLTGDPEFDRCFLVFGEPAAGPLFLAPALRAWLLELRRAPGRWYRHLYLHAGLVAVVEPTPAPPGHIEAMMAIARGVCERLGRVGSTLDF